AGVLVREHPALEVHVSAVGAPHLVDPSRLEASARRLYGDAFDDLWGELAPMPEANIRVVGERVLDLVCFPTPGHASHHVCYLAADGTLYAGDAAGVRIQPHREVLPPTPPPEFDPDAWLQTIDELERRAPARLALIHFGIADDVARHLAELRLRLEEWVALEGVTEEEFTRTVGRDVDESYARAMPFWQSYAGLKRCWEQRRRSYLLPAAVGARDLVLRDVPRTDRGRVRRARSHRLGDRHRHRLRVLDGRAGRDAPRRRRRGRPPAAA